ncbi:MAG: hypothetical protein DMD60_03025 [Gemmatimonadetes bacterium]|nr:MAG: hypothetical protein DMD60_03025 [Gemmatimonadota bacterium]
MSSFPRGLALLCAIPFVLQACGGRDTAPAGPAAKPAKLANAGTTAAQLQAVTAPFETDAFQNFAALQQHFGPAGFAPVATLASTAPALVPSHAVVPGPLSTDAATRVWRGALANPPFATAIFRDTVRGKTFVWDTTAARYVASTAAGAPANGVRFVLYATRPPTSEPSRPLTAMGYADLTDQSTASAAVLGVVILGGTGPTLVTYASYTVARSAAPAREWALAGFVTDGTTLLDLTSGVTSTSTLTVQTAVDDATDGTHVSETGTLSRTWENGADFSLTGGADTVRATGSVALDTTGHTWGSGSVAVTVNGQAFATITVGPTGPSYSGASGVQLTSADETALANLFTASFSLFGAVTVLTDAAWVLGL